MGRSRTLEEVDSTTSPRFSPGARRIVVGSVASLAAVGSGLAFNVSPSQAIHCEDGIPGCVGANWDPKNPLLGSDINPALINADSPPRVDDIRECQRADTGNYKDASGRSLAYKVVARGIAGKKTLVVKVGLADMQLNGANMSAHQSPTESLLFKASCDGVLVDSSVGVSVTDKRGKRLGKFARRLKLTDAQTGFKGPEKGPGYIDRLTHRFDSTTGLKDSDLVWKTLRIKLKRALPRGARVETDVLSAPSTKVVSAASSEGSPLRPLAGSLPSARRFKIRRPVKIR